MLTSNKGAKLIRKRIVSYLCCSMFVLTSATGAAENPAEEYSLDEMVVTASKINQPIKDVTSPVSVITQEDIKNSSAKTVAELLPFVPGVSLQSGGGLGSQTGIQMRGFNGGSGSHKMLLLIDGRPANTSFKGDIDWNSIPIDSVERIEVVRGPVSALYGDNSLGGAVNIITKKADKNSTIIKSSYGSFGTYTTSLVQEGRDKDFAYMFTAGYGKTDGHIEHSDYEGNNYSLKMSFGDDLTFRSGYTKYDRTNPDATKWDFDKAEGYYIDLEKKLPSKWDTRLRVYQNVMDTDNYDKDWKIAEILKEDTVGVQLQQNIKVSDKKTFTWGSDYQNMKADDISYKNGKATMVDKSLNSMALYFQNDQELNSKLHMNVGGRFDHHSAYGSQFSPKFGLAYHCSEDTTYKLNIARAYKAPSISDLYGKNGNPDLKPTKLWSYDLGVEKQFDQRTKGSMTFYYTDAENVIIGTGQSSDSKKSNSTLQPKGVELEFVKKADEHFNYFINYTYLDVGDMTRWSSEHKGNFGIKYKNRQMKASLMQQYVGTSYDEDLKKNPNAAKIDAYSITNLKVTYAPSEKYEMSLGVENMFNRYYETFKDDPMPGRAYAFSLTSKF